MEDYFSREWASAFGDGLGRDWRLAGLRHTVPIELSVSDGSKTLTILVSRAALNVELRSEAETPGLVLTADPATWEALFTDEQESLTRLTRQGRIRLIGDRAGILLRWRVVFAIVEALALTVRGEI